MKSNEPEYAEKGIFLGKEQLAFVSKEIWYNHLMIAVAASLFRIKQDLPSS